MAIIKAVRGIGKSHSTLTKLLDYVCKKSELISGINCSGNSQTVANEFLETKKFYGKTSGRQYKHLVQSFNPNEVTPELAHKIGIELSETFKGFEVLVVTHLDREHFHNHIILNSVNLENGKKYHENNSDLENIKTISDNICLRNNLKIIDRTQEKNNEISTTNSKLYKLLEGVTTGTRESDIVNLSLQIKQTAKNSISKENFIENLNKNGINVDWTKERRHITFTISKEKLIGKKNKFRLERLHNLFKEDIFSEGGLENEFRRTRELSTNERKNDSKAIERIRTESELNSKQTINERERLERDYINPKHQEQRIIEPNSRAKTFVRSTKSNNRGLER